MQRWINILAVFLGLQVLLAAGLMLRGDRLTPAKSDTPLIAVDLKSVDRLAIDGPVSPQTDAGKATEATRVELAKRDGRWVMPANFDAPADTKKVEAVLKQLTDAKRGMPIATSAQALDRFKVGERDYERRVLLRQGDKALATVYLGAAPGGRKANARESHDLAVYSVDVATFDLPTRSSDWFDHALLHRDPATLTRIEIAQAGKPAIALRRAAPAAPGKEAQASDDGAAEKQGANEADAKRDDAKKDAAKKDDAASKPAAPAWSAEGLGTNERIDPAKVDELVQSIANLRVDGVLGTQPQPEWQKETPALRVTLAGAQDKTVTWTLTRIKPDGTHVLKTSDQPWYFELKSWDASPLLDAAAKEKLVAGSSAATPPAKAR
jgi:hypothetical protein